MKKFYLLLTLLAAFLNNKAQFTYQSPWPTGEKINSICAAGPDRVFAVGENKTILRSDDNGLHRTNQFYNPVMVNIYYDVCFTGPEQGFIVGNKETILKTADGGNSWEEKYSSQTGELISVHFPTSNVGYAIGDHKILKTSDAGESWTQLANTSATNVNKQIFFRNVNEGYLLESNLLSKTTDGGVNWQTVHSDAGLNYSSLWCNDSDIFIGNEEGQIIRSSDGGNTWTVIFNVSGESIHSICFKNESDGWVSCNSYVLRTHDGGNRWDTIYTGFGSGGKIVFTDSQQGIMANGKRILRTGNAGSNWELVTTGDLSYFIANFKDICFVSATKGYVVNADKGCILNTNDGGEHWSSQNTIPQGNYTSVRFFNELAGIAAGYNGIIVRTTNGGSTWNVVPGTTTNAIKSLSIGDASTGYAAGDGVLLKTTDAGASWINCFTDPFYTSKEFLVADFISADVGFISTYFDIYKTTDGGQSFSWCKGDGAQAMFFTDANTGYAVPVHMGEIYKTADGGESWTTQTIQSTGIYSIWFTSQNTGYAVGDKVFKTTDGGATWINKDGFYGIGLSKVFFADQNIGYAIQANNILKTTDAGSSWFYVKGGSSDFSSVFFVDENHGYVCGSNSIMKVTEDAGASWKTYECATFSEPHSLFFSTINIGYALDTKRILKTTDAGKNWQTMFYSNEYLHCIFFVDNNTGFAAGDNGSLLKTTDQGITWTEINIVTSEDLYSVHFSNVNKGILMGNNGTILSTEDNGNTWSVVPNSFNTDFRQVQFVDADNGFAIGNGNDTTSTMVLKTTTKGMTWIKMHESIDWYQFKSMYFVDTCKGYFVSGDPFRMTVSKTINSGVNLNQIYPIVNYNTDFQFKSVFFSNHDKGYVVGGDNVILGIENGGTSLGLIDNKPDGNTGDYTVYPNPSDRYITISKTNSNLGKNIRIKIFNLHGQEVTPEIMMNKSEKIIDVSLLGKGMYLLRITGGTKNVWKKIIVQ